MDNMGRDIQRALWTVIALALLFGACVGAGAAIGISALWR